MLIFFVLLRYERLNQRVHVVFFFFFIHTSTKRKKSTVSSYNLISNHFHAKLQGKQLTNGHGGMIIQFRAAIFERIRNVQIQALQTVFICLLSLPFLCVFHL